MRQERLWALFRYVLFLLLSLFLLFMTGDSWILGVVCLMVLLPAVFWGINFMARGKLRVSVHLPTTTGKDTAVSGTVDIQNDSVFSVTKLYCHLLVYNELTDELESVILSGAVGAKNHLSLDYLLQSGFCGRLSLRVERLTLMDRLGFIPLSVPVEASARITVLPELFSSEVELSGLSSDDEEGTADCRGTDRTEVFQIRQYLPGDDIRQIHWKLSSKLEEILVREPSRPVSRSLLVLWDKRVAGTPAVMDALAAGVSSVSQALADAGAEFVLCWTEKDEPEYRQIAQTDDLLTAIPALVKSRGGENCPLPEMTAFGRVLYFTCDAASVPPAEPGIFPVVCMPEDGEIPGGLVFTPDNCAGRLERLEI